MRINKDKDKDKTQRTILVENMYMRRMYEKGKIRKKERHIKV